MKYPVKEYFLADTFYNDMLNVIAWLDNRKTYGLAILGIVYAVAGYFTGHLGGQSAIDTVWACLVIIAGRHAISKI